MKNAELTKALCHLKANTPIWYEVGAEPLPLHEPDGSQTTARRLVKWLSALDPEQGMAIIAPAATTPTGWDRILAPPHPVVWIGVQGDKVVLVTRDATGSIPDNRGLIASLSLFRPTTPVAWRTDAYDEPSQIGEGETVASLSRWLNDDPDLHMEITGNDGFSYSMDWVEVWPDGVVVCAYELMGQPSTD
jgi:hypothetical protein